MSGARGGILTRMAKGAGWVLAWRMATRSLGLISTLVLVRLLDKSDFGLITLAYGFSAALEASLAIGVETQIVRARDPSRALYDTAFTLNVIRGVLLAILVVAGAAPVARFFGDVRLENVVYVLALLPLSAGFTNVGVMDFQRALDFGKEFRLIIVPRLLQVIVAIGAAVVLRSYWALLLGIAVARVMNMAMSYVMHPFRPRLSLAAWRDLLGVSFWTWTGNVAAVIRDRMDSFIIGRLLGLPPVGIYTVSLEIATLPASELVTPIGRAGMAGFAATNRAGATAVAETFLRLIGFTALIAIPAGIGVSLVAGPIVALALGQTWAEAAGLIRLLGFVCVFLSLGLVCNALLNALAMMRTLFLISLAGAALKGLFLFVFAPRLGLTGVGLAVVFASVAENLTLVLVGARRAGVSSWAILPRLWRPLLASLVMVLVLLAAGLGWQPVPQTAVQGAVALAIGAALGAAAYAAALSGLWWLSGRPPAAEADALELLRRALGGLRQRLGWGG